MHLMEVPVELRYLEDYVAVQCWAESDSLKVKKK
jgi:hypothetical protein